MTDSHRPKQGRALLAQIQPRVTGAAMVMHGMS